MQLSLIPIITDYQIIVTIVMLLFAWKWGDWKNWKLYYPTMLFFALGDFTYGLLTYNYPLWEFESPLLKTTLSDLLISLVFFPATILIYLPHYPKTFIKQALYILMFISVYTIVEKVSYLLGFFSYHNGWSIGWSILFNFMMFPLLYLHHKKPHWAILVAVAVAISILAYFKVPYNTMK